MFNGPFKHDKRMIPARLSAGLTLFAAISFGQLDDLKNILQALLAGNIKGAMSYSFILVILLAILVFNGLAAFLQWRRQEFILTDDTFEMKDTKLIKRLMRIRLADISNVQIKEPLGCRALGIAQVCINTNTRATASRTDMTVYLAKDRALALKDALKGGALAKQIGEDRDLAPEGDRPAWGKHYSTRELARHWLLSLSWFSLFVLALGLIWAGLAAFIVLVLGGSLAWLPINEIGKLAPLAILPLLTAFIFPFIRQTALTWIRWWDFRVAYDGDRLLLEHGLLTRKSFTMPIDRIHAVTIEQNFIGRLLGYGSVTVVNVGLEDENEGLSSQLLLAAPLGEIFNQLETLLPGTTWAPSLVQQPKRSMVPLTFSSLVVLVLLTGCLLYFIPGVWKLMALPPVLFFPLYALAASRTPGVQWQGDQIVLVEGTFDRRWHFLHECHIEQLAISEKWLPRLLGLSQITCTILSPSILTASYLSGYYPLTFWSPFLKKWVRWKDRQLKAEKASPN
ncbi:PH domain-containing protein [Peptococcus simiae]|uniref:PH domain-containing protein n=1 Tax=Peptococcus simiae TaxID=1643805 RepID=UPI0039812718